MAIEKVKPEGGLGGRIGHSNMTHWTKTAEVMNAARKHRRAADKDAVEEGQDDYSGRRDIGLDEKAR